MNVKLTKRDKIKIINTDDIFEVMQRILKRENKIDRDKEHFWIIGLAVNNRILFIELVCMGSVKAATVEPMNVFRVAVLKNAVKVILVHNHPHDEVQPSRADKSITDRLIQVGRILDIEVIDHMIITLRSFLSFMDIGLLEKLQASTQWVPPFEIAQRIKKEEAKLRKQAVKAAEEKGIKKGKKEMAKGMKENGIDPAVIGEISGLSKKEIEKL